MCVCVFVCVSFIIILIETPELLPPFCLNKKKQISNTFDDLECLAHGLGRTVPGVILDTANTFVCI